MIVIRLWLIVLFPSFIARRKVAHRNERRLLPESSEGCYQTIIVYGRAHRCPVCGVLLCLFQIAIEPFAFHHDFVIMRVSV